MEPRVNFHRKYTNVSCAILFLVSFALHLGIGFIFATDSAFHLLPQCQETNCTYTRNGCPTEQVQLLGPDQIVLQPCSNPCHDGYIPWIGFICLEKKSIKNYENHPKCQRRLTQQEQEGESVAAGFDLAVTHSLQLIIPLLLAVLCFTIGWGFFLQTFPRAMVWSTVGLQYVALMALAAWGIAENVPVVAVFAAVVLIPISVVLYRISSSIKASAELLAASGAAFKAYPSVIGYNFILKLIWFLYAVVSIYVCLKGILYRHYTYHAPSCFTFPEQPAWTKGALLLFSSQFAWTTALVQQIRWATVAGTVSMWYFHKDDPELPASPPRTAFRWALTTSFGTHCFAAIIVAFVQQLKRLSQSKIFLYSNPAGWFCLCILTLLKSVLEALSRYAAVVHVLTGAPMLKAGKITYELLTKHLKNAFLTSFVSANVLATGATILAYSTCWVSLVSLLIYNHIPPTSSVLLENSHAIMVFLWFILLTICPTESGLLLILIVSLAGDKLSIDVALLGIASFIGLMAVILFRYAAAILSDGISAAFVCFTVASDHSIEFEQTAEFQRLMRLKLGISPEDTSEPPKKDAKWLKEQATENIKKFTGKFGI